MGIRFRPRYPCTMATAAGSEGSAGDASPKLSLWHRLFLRPRLDSEQPKVSFMDRLRLAALKPEDPDTAPRGAYDLSGEELEIEEKRANDKERAIGLLAGPFATIISFVVINELVSHNPSAYLADGALNPQHVNTSTYTELFWVLIILSFGITGMALWRKRLYLGIVMSLYGLAIFNLHYWGFGVPFVMVGAWYLVRAYRLRRNLKVSTADDATPSVGTRRPASNKRYTPPS
jgi:hypothetical protein